MKWKWDDFSEKEQEKLELLIQKNLPVASCEHTRDFLKVLIELKYPWKDSHNIQETLIKRMVHLFHDKSRITPNSPSGIPAESLAEVIHSLGGAPKHTFQWNKLPKDFQIAVLNGIEVYSPSFNQVDMGHVFEG
jgi:hypothetical protein